MHGNTMPHPALLIARRDDRYLAKLAKRLAKGMDAGRFVTIVIGQKNFHLLCPFPVRFFNHTGYPNG